MAGVDQEEGDKFDPYRVAASKKKGLDAFKAAKLEQSKKGLKLALESGDAVKKTGDAVKSAGDLTKAQQYGVQQGADLASKVVTEGGETTDEGAGAAGGAMQGAAAGLPLAAATGGMSVLIGGAIGGISGAIGAGEARKKKLAKIEAEKQQKLGNIAERKAEKLQSAFSNLGASLSGLF